jgi:hypothetical protein
MFVKILFIVLIQYVIDNGSSLKQQGIFGRERCGLTPPF